MKSKLFILVATSVAIIGCGAPATTPQPDATGARGASGTYKVQALGDEVVAPVVSAVPMPFFRKNQLSADLEDGDAFADMLAGMPLVGSSDSEAPPVGDSKVAFTVTATETLTNAGQFITSGEIDFQDRGRNLRFRGKVDDMSAFLSEQILYATVTGPIEKGTQDTPNAEPPTGGGINHGKCREWKKEAKCRLGRHEKTCREWSHYKSKKGGYSVKSWSWFFVSLINQRLNLQNKPTKGSSDSTGQEILGPGYRFSLDIGEHSPYQVVFTFKATKVGEDVPFYQYSGLSEKGKLKLTLK
ncbi:MAG: hypothetical protein ACK46X_10965 [Candidatus Sericytochromatia bacterium]